MLHDVGEKSIKSSISVKTHMEGHTDRIWVILDFCDSSFRAFVKQKWKKIHIGHILALSEANQVSSHAQVMDLVCQ